MRQLASITILILVFSVSAIAQPRVGYMNPQAVLDNLPEKEAIERQLNRFLDSREAEFEEKSIEFQNNLARFQQEAPELSEEETQRRQQELQQQDQELEQFQMRIQQELEQRQDELLGPVLREMNNIIESIAQDMNLDYVLNQETGQGEMLLLYISEDGKKDLDLTEKVLSRMTN